jgi:hypothetical protein
MRFKIRRSEPEWWLIITVLSLWIIGIGKVEGYVAPAAAPMTLTKIITAPPIQNNLFRVGPKVGFYIWGESNRLRPNCAFRDLQFFLGERNGPSVPLRVELEPAVVRDDGNFFFGPWWVESQTIEQFKNDTFANAIHKCKFLGLVPQPWLTVSRFWN